MGAADRVQVKAPIQGTEEAGCQVIAGRLAGRMAGTGPVIGCGSPVARRWWCRVCAAGSAVVQADGHAPGSFGMKMIFPGGQRVPVAEDRLATIPGRGGDSCRAGAIPGASRGGTRGAAVSWLFKRAAGRRRAAVMLCRW